LGSENVVDGIVPGAGRRLTVRDLMTSKPVTEAGLHFIRESGFTNNASAQTEDSAKAESAMTLEVESVTHPYACTPDALHNPSN
jgi:hypothetical protein